MKILIKVSCIIAIIFVLAIMIGMIALITNERRGLREEVIEEISQSFGAPQRIIAPLLRINYDSLRVYTGPDNQTIREKNPLMIILPPDNLDIDVKMNVEKKNRRIYYSTVYTSEITIRGDFSLNEYQKEQIESIQRSISGATLYFSVQDRKGLKGLIEGNFGNDGLDFTSGNQRHATLNAAIDLDNLLENDRVPFEIVLPLNGSRKISFVPTGLESTFHVVGNWPHPSFYGEYLPERRVVTDDGFEADWATTWLAGHLLGGKNLTAESSDNSRWLDYSSYEFGINFLELVDVYSLVNRSLKYSFLIIGLTFLVIFVTEMIIKSHIHPVQYGLIGTALVVFYLLLLSLSEQIPFAMSYLVAAVACIALITFYIYYALKNFKATVIFSGFLILLYFVLYILLNISDFALLIGSLLIFITLAVVMIATRKINWYNMQ